jgi:hypothetical protein
MPGREMDVIAEHGRCSLARLIRPCYVAPLMMTNSG